MNSPIPMMQHIHINPAANCIPFMPIFRWEMNWMMARATIAIRMIAPIIMRIIGSLWDQWSTSKSRGSSHNAS